MSTFVSGKVQLERKIIEFFYDKTKKFSVHYCNLYFHHEDNASGVFSVQLTKDSKNKDIDFYDLKEFLQKFNEYINEEDDESDDTKAKDLKGMLLLTYKIVHKENADVINRATNDEILCPYCLEVSDSKDPRVLCQDCRETFGHTMIDEL